MWTSYLLCRHRHCAFRKWYVNMLLTPIIVDTIIGIFFSWINWQGTKCQAPRDTLALKCSKLLLNHCPIINKRVNHFIKKLQRKYPEHSDNKILILLGSDQVITLRICIWRFRAITSPVESSFITAYKPVLRPTSNTLRMLNEFATITSISSHYFE